MPVAPATAVAAARLGDDEHRWAQEWVAATTEQEPGIAAGLLDRLGPLGARRSLRLVRSGDGGTRAELAGALVRHSGLGELQELIASRFLGRADALRARSVLAGLDALMRAVPPGAGHRLHYQLERVRAGAHELRELELLGMLRSGEVLLPDEQRCRAERLLGADGDDPGTRLGLAARAPAERVRSAAATEADRWRQVAAHPVMPAAIRDAAQALVRTCERLAAEADFEVERGE